MQHDKAEWDRPTGIRPGSQQRSTRECWRKRTRRRVSTAHAISMPDTYRRRLLDVGEKSESQESVPFRRALRVKSLQAWLTRINTDAPESSKYKSCRRAFYIIVYAVWAFRNKVSTPRQGRIKSSAAASATESKERSEECALTRRNLKHFPHTCLASTHNSPRFVCLVILLVLHLFLSFFLFVSCVVAYHFRKVAHLLKRKAKSFLQS